MSNDNVFVEGLRQRPNKKKIEAWKDGEFEGTTATQEVMRNYERNKKLIDLDNVPVELSENILKTFHEAFHVVIEVKY